MPQPLIPTPSESPDAWNNLIIDSQVAPGAPQIKVTRDLDVDEKKPGSGNKGTLTTNGAKLIKFDITLRLWEDANDDIFTTQLEDARALVQKLIPSGKVTPVPYVCQHPILAFHDVRALFFTGAEGPDESGGIWTIKLKATEFNPTKSGGASSTSTPKGTRPGAYVLPDSMSRQVRDTTSSIFGAISNALPAPHKGRVRP